MRRLSWSLAAVVFVAAAGGATGPDEPVRQARTGSGADLPTYIKKDEPKFSWKLKNKMTTDAGTTYELELVSQEWHDITWKHRIDVFQPKDVKPNATMLIYNTGGYNAGYPLFGFELANKIKAPVAFLYDIPNQPLFDGKKEDALIAETFVRALETKDTTWPLLFPMAKSVVKAMDALQAFTKDEFKEQATRFVLTGGSKRGWTTWLASASDPRIVAFAPLVIDTLKMTDQMEHQLQSFGKYSEMIHDYTERKLVPLPPGEDAKKLWQMVDPYFYREQAKQPKLLINGTNDPYWTGDALNLYWDDLKGDKWVLYVPNAGHNLQEPDKSRARATNALAAFARSVTVGKPFPTLKWKHDDADGKARLKIETSAAPKAARVWTATAPTRDFREAKWKESAATIADNTILVTAERPKEGYKEFFVEMEYEIDGIKYNLSTQLRVLEKAK
jgi:PhoPQ-activated pathogenicity-related protein